MTMRCCNSETAAPRSRHRAAAAFTLLELLGVIGVIGVLVGLLLPSLDAARTAGLRARTKVQFAQWHAAVELFRQEYGYYPAIAQEGVIDSTRFAAALLGCQTLAGEPWPADATAEQLAGNVRRLRFLQLSPGDVAGDVLQDAFGNTVLGVRVDVDDDARIGPSDTGNGYVGRWVAVAGDAGVPLSPVDAEATLATAPLPGRVVFYSPGRGRRAADLVLSWR